MSEDKLFDRVGRVCASGEILFRDGDAGDTMYVLRSGRVRVFKEANGRQKTLAFIEAGDFFGEMALLNNKRRTASAECVEETRLLVIDGKMFEAMLRGNAEIAVRMIQRLAKRLDQANGLVGVLMQKDPKARVILGLQGRAAVRFRARDGSLVNSVDVGRALREVGPFVQHELHQRSDHSVDLRLRPAPSIPVSVAGMRRALEAVFGPGVEVRVELVQAFPHAGKPRTFVSDLS